MYRLGAMLIAASLLLGCSKKADDPVANSPAQPAVKSVAENAVKTPPKSTEPAVKTPPKSTEPAVKTPPKSTEPVGTAPEKEATVTIADLMAEADAADDEFMDKVRSAPPEERRALFMTGGSKKEFAVKLLDLAKEDTEDENAFSAILYAAHNGDESVSAAAFSLIVDEFADDDQVTEMLQEFGRSAGLPGQRHVDFLKSLAEKSTNDAVKGGASFALFKLIQSIKQVSEMIADEPEIAKSFPPESIAFLTMDRDDDSDEHLQTLLASVSKDFADVDFGGKTLGELADEELFVFKHLSLGKVAPDIEGKDLDDKPFKLSDYRGKVVMLDFWGDW